MLQQARLARSGRRGHRRRQVDEPARVDREPAHHLERRECVLLPDSHGAAGEPGLHNALADDVVDVQFGGVAAGAVGLGRCADDSATSSRTAERPGRLVVHPARRNADQFALGVAEGGEAAAEHAAGVDANGAVDPHWFRYRRMPVHHHGLAAIILRPRVPDGQAEVVGLTRRIAVEGKRAHSRRGSAVHGRWQAGMRDDELAVIEHEMPEQPVHELRRLGGEAFASGCELGQALGQAMTDGDISAAQRAHELRLVVPGHAERGAGCRHAHH